MACVNRGGWHPSPKHGVYDSVDLIFKMIYRENLYNLLPALSNLKLIELIGDQKQRLHQIQAAIESFAP
jgi:hypothetical protein